MIGRGLRRVRTAGAIEVEDAWECDHSLSNGASVARHPVILSLRQRSERRLVSSDVLELAHGVPHSYLGAAATTASWPARARRDPCRHCQVEAASGRVRR